MNPDHRVPDRQSLVFRAGLLALGLPQLFVGLYALLSPTGFFDDFPFGRSWVAALPAYNEHLVRDVGGLFLGTAVVLLAAAWYLDRRLVAVSLVSFLAFTVPHTTFHMFNLEPYATGDVIANVLALSSQVLIPVALLALLARARRGAPAPRRVAPPAEGWRVEPVTSTLNPFVRFAFRTSRKHGGGEVLDPLRVYAHNPTIMAGYGVLEMATERSQRIPARLRLLVELRAAMLGGCEWCLDYASSISAASQIGEEDLRALPDYASSDRFSETERLALDYATGMSATPVEVPEELFARLRERFDEAELVELTNLIALENYRARFNWAFGLAGQGFTDGAYCVRPADPAAAAGAAPAG